VTATTKEAKKCTKCGLPRTNFYMRSGVCVLCVEKLFGSETMPPRIVTASVGQTPSASKKHEEEVSAAYSRLLEKEKQQVQSPETATVIAFPQPNTNKEPKMNNTKVRRREFKIDDTTKAKRARHIKRLRTELGLSVAKAVSALGCNKYVILNGEREEYGLSEEPYNDVVAGYKQLKLDMERSKEAIPGNLPASASAAKKGGRQPKHAASKVVTKPLHTPKTTTTAPSKTAKPSPDKQEAVKNEKPTAPAATEKPVEKPKLPKIVPTHSMLDLDIVAKSNEQNPLFWKDVVRRMAIIDRQKTQLLEEVMFHVMGG